MFVFFRRFNFGDEWHSTPKENDDFLLEDGFSVLLESGERLVLENEATESEEDKLLLANGDYILLSDGSKLII